MALHPSQHAYRKHRSIWTAKAELVEEVKSHGYCIVASLDLSKAFDKVTRHALISALTRWDIPLFEQQLILEQYRDANVQVELNGKTGKPFRHSRGIRQGCVLSGLLFNMVIAKLFYQVEAKVTTAYYKLISYSDDIIVIAKDCLTVQVVTKTLQRELDGIGLLLNEEKTRIITFDMKEEAKETFEWLGTTFTTNLDWTQEVSARVQHAKDAGQEIKHLCQQNNVRLHNTVKVNVISSLVVSHLKITCDILEYSSEDRRVIYNTLTAILLDNTSFGEEAASQQAKELLGMCPKPQTTKRKTFQSKDKPPLPGLDLVSATPDQVERRKQYSSSLQEERKWCILCDPPAYYKDINGHRHRIHQVDSLPRLLIHCLSCQRNIDSNQYHRHVCIGTSIPEGLTPCPTCNAMYGKHGMARHIPACIMKNAD